MDQTLGIIIMALCYVVGSGLIIMEAFMPGFGVAGISGLVLEIVAIVLTNSYFGTLWAVLGTVVVLLFIGTAVFISYRSAMKGRLSKSPLVLRETENDTAASSPAAEDWINQEGVTVTSLRPAGMIEIGGQRLNASTNGEFLSRGTAVRVVGAEGDHLVITKV